MAFLFLLPWADQVLKRLWKLTIAFFICRSLSRGIIEKNYMEGGRG